MPDLDSGLPFEDALAKRADPYYDTAVAMPAFTGCAPDQPVEEYVQTVYEDVLLRPGTGGDAPTFNPTNPKDAATDVGCWVAKLASGEITRGQLVTEFLKAVDDLKSNSSVTPQEQAIANQVADALANRAAPIVVIPSELGRF
ncbi:MAG: hypothetical protein JXQ99_16170 [Hyphomicrobiaceae bacterium]